MPEIMKPGQELLSDLADMIANRLESRSIPESEARHIAESIAMDMAGHWGGQLIYFPKGTHIILSKRDQEIYARFTGNNHKDLAREYNVCVQRIYTIIKIMTCRDLDDRHGDLFPPGQA